MTFGYSFIKTRQDFCNLSVLGFSFFAISMVYSIQAPIYPIVAASKGASATEFGAVFGIYDLVLLLMSPVASMLVLRFGSWWVFNSSAILIGTATTTFGFLGYVDGRILFDCLSFLLRILEGIGCAGIAIAAYALLAREFPENTSATFGILEMSFGIGLSLGPVVGTSLYNVGVSSPALKFVIPFVSLGSFHFVSVILTNWALRSGASSSRKLSDSDGLKSTEPLGFLELLRLPSIIYFAVLITAGTFNYGFQSALLSTYLNGVGLTSVQTGAIYLVYGATYTLSNPICSKYADSMDQPLYLSLAGALGFVIVFVLYILSSLRLWTVPLIILASGLLGISHANLIMTAYVLCMRKTVQCGHVDTESSSAQVSALWLSAYSLGGFLGPSIAGLVFDLTSFLGASIIFLATNILLTLSIPIYITTERRRLINAGDGMTETTPLKKSEQKVQK